MSDDPLPLSKIIKSVKKRYDEDDDKDSWMVRGGQDRDGNRDMLISRDPEAWYIKSKAIDPHRSISYGQHLNIRSLDDEIATEVGKKKFNPDEAFHSLFGMAVPTSEKDLITAAGIQKIAPKEMSFVNSRIDERYPNARKHLRKKVKKVWNQEFPDRDNVFL